MAVKPPVVPKGFALPGAELLELGFKNAAESAKKSSAMPEKPLLRPIPPRAVRELEERGHWGTPEHREALRKAADALKMYVDGKAYCNDKDELAPEYWPHLQERICYRQEREILAGGSKGAAKTVGGMIWIASGNPLEPAYDAQGKLVACNTSYFYHPEFTGLVLRKNVEDLNEWVRTSLRFYGPAFGAEWRGGEGRAGFMKFPSGAVVRVGHLEDPRSYEKYFGKPIHRLIIEELIQINPDLYMQLVGCVRSTFSEIRAQILATTNPIGGPFVQDVFDRFIEPKMMDARGRKVPILDDGGVPLSAFRHDGITPVYPEVTIKEPIDPKIYERLGLEIPAEPYSTRCFIPGRISDNPHLLHDTGYIAALATMDEKEREGQLMGMWNVAGGSMFKEFRAKGPLPGEPENANHVVKSEGRTIPVWYHRLMGLDWGFEHECVCYCMAHDQGTHQVHVYREMIWKEVVPEMVGVAIARTILPELNAMPNKSMTLWVGSDVEHNRVGSQRSVIELLMKGMRAVLNPNMVHSPELLIQQLEAEMMEKGEMPNQQLVDTIRARRQPGINIRRVNTSPGVRVLGWQMIRSYLRWLPMESLENLQDWDPKEAMRLFYDGENGTTKLNEYVKDCFRKMDETLPRLQIWDCCPGLIEALPKLQKSEKNAEDANRQHFLGLDRVDAFRHCITGFQEEEGIEPEYNFVERHIQRLRDANPNLRLDDIIRARELFEAKYHSENSTGAVQIPKGARMLREGMRDLAAVDRRLQ